ncbi:MAG: prenyltransferase [Dehalococcoidia bacterium]|nr:prenyltransferase [Dehalococcoidia bacterium]
MVSKVKLYFMETRPQFLVLSVVLVFLGTVVAWADGHFNVWRSLLAMVGLLSLHTSVNVLNDYFDYRSGVDLRTVRTPFSGGSGMLPAGLLSPKSVLVYGIATFMVAVPIGAYFVVVSGWGLLPLLMVGAVCVLMYTQKITRLGYGMAEAAAGLGLGTLPVLGAYYVQTGFYTWPALVASIPSGILVCNLLFLNEFPDVEADMVCGKRTIPIIIGKRKASRLYTGLTIMMYVWIAGGVLARLVGLPGLPLAALLALLTIPFAIKAVRGSRHYDDRSQLVPALGANVMVVLFTQVLLGVGYIGDSLF